MTHVAANALQPNPLNPIRFITYRQV
jgi:hypothetical protein